MCDELSCQSSAHQTLNLMSLPRESGSDPDGFNCYLSPEDAARLPAADLEYSPGWQVHYSVFYSFLSNSSQVYSSSCGSQVGGSGDCHRIERLGYSLSSRSVLRSSRFSSTPRLLFPFLAYRAATLNQCSELCGQETACSTFAFRLVAARSSRESRRGQQESDITLAGYLAVVVGTPASWPGAVWGS